MNITYKDKLMEKLTDFVNDIHSLIIDGVLVIDTDNIKELSNTCEEMVRELGDYLKLLIDCVDSFDQFMRSLNYGQKLIYKLRKEFDNDK